MTSLLDRRLGRRLVRPHFRASRKRFCVRRGTTAAELALSLPVILLLTLVSSDFGRIAYYQEAVANAARVGAEAGATHKRTPVTEDVWEERIREAALDELANLPAFADSEATIAVETHLDGDGRVVATVEVAYPFRTIVTWPGLPADVTLRHAVTMRQFR